ncbi:hypothetical protein DFH94DRAFT_688310 [Russula ochroleuca]|uniref:Uncharacterized protein n=1 Tax=Russula ochroleuca TaxID=152965 RepID=A0A9P5N4M9_9AGAM|nr:hypothetical protein DFH94DRAFT_688310 [Russula ochroleuca]
MFSPLRPPSSSSLVLALIFAVAVGRAALAHVIFTVTLPSSSFRPRRCHPRCFRVSDTAQRPDSELSTSFEIDSNIRFTT